MTVSEEFVIGILALQGAFHEHKVIIDKISQGRFKTLLVKTETELNSVDGLILPGGESTAMALIAERNNFLEPLRKFVRTKPCWGTCAGLILLAQVADKAKKGGQQLLGGLDIAVNRNQFGTQLESFEKPILTSCLSNPTVPFNCFFIRAPVITKILNNDVEILSKVEQPEFTLRDNLDQQLNTFIVAVKQNHLLGTSFHPELTGDYRWHEYFLTLVSEFYQK